MGLEEGLAILRTEALQNAIDQEVKQHNDQEAAVLMEDQRNIDLETFKTHVSPNLDPVHFTRLGISETLTDIANKVQGVIDEAPYIWGEFEIRDGQVISIAKACIEQGVSWNVKKPDRWEESSYTTNIFGANMGPRTFSTSHRISGEIIPHRIGVVIWYVNNPANLYILEYSGSSQLIKPPYQSSRYRLPSKMSDIYGMRNYQMSLGEKSKYVRILSQDVSQERFKSQRVLAERYLSSK